MATIAWTEEMSVGVAELDDDHRRLIAMLATVDGGPGGGDPLAPLHDLVEYCRGHFAREEAYMATIGYPGLAAHQRQHDALTQDVVESLLDQSGEPDPELPRKLGAFLRLWIETHILNADRKYALHARTAR